MRRRPPPAGALTTHVPGLVRASVVWPFPLWPPGQPPWLGATVGLRRFHLSVLAGGRGCGAFCAELLKNVTTGRRRQAPWDTRGARTPTPRAQKRRVSRPRRAGCRGDAHLRRSLFCDPRKSYGRGDAPCAARVGFSRRALGVPGRRGPGRVQAELLRERDACDPGEVPEPAGSRTSLVLVGESRTLAAGAGGPAVARSRNSPQQRE